MAIRSTARNLFSDLTVNEVSVRNDFRFATGISIWELTVTSEIPQTVRQNLTSPKGEGLSAGISISVSSWVINLSEIYIDQC